MNPRNYALLQRWFLRSIAVLQLTRAILGWPVTVETAWGMLSIPLWPNWIGCAAFAVLAWLGFATARKFWS